MPDTTAELGLNLAKDTDDCADYETVYLRNSLTTLDGLFNAASGHTHAGAHQGGPINGNAFAAAIDIPDWFRSTGQRSAFATAGAGAELFWNGTSGVLQSYDRAAAAWRPMIIGGSTLALNTGGTSRLSIDASGNVTITGPLNVNGNTSLNAVAISSSLTVGATLNVTGSVTGAEFHANNGNLYLGSAHIYDGGGGATTLGGGLNAGSTTLSSLTVNGNETVTGTLSSGTHTVNGNLNATGNVSTLNNASNVAPYTVGGTPEHIEHGHPSCNGVGAGSYGTYAQTFTRAFSGNPIVILTIDTPTSGDIKDWHVAAQNVSTTGFNIRIHNATGSGGNCTVDWFAIGV